MDEPASPTTRVISAVISGLARFCEAGRQHPRVTAHNTTQHTTSLSSTKRRYILNCQVAESNTNQKRGTTHASAPPDTETSVLMDTPTDDGNSHSVGKILARQDPPRPPTHRLSRLHTQKNFVCRTGPPTTEFGDSLSNGTPVLIYKTR